MRAKLTLESGDASPAEFHLDVDKIYKLGRNRENHIVLRDQHASRQHAEIYSDLHGWMLRDLKTTNGTRLNGQKVTNPTPLTDGCEVRVGEVRMRFVLDVPESPTDEVEVPPELRAEEHPVEVIEPVPLRGESIDENTDLEPDELTALLNFMNNSLGETTPAGVVGLALRAIHRQARATVTGYLSLDEVDAPPKMVLPELSRVDIHLSSQLTQHARRERRTAWAADLADVSGFSTESLVSYQDAFCVPVPGEDGPLGALHVYRTGSTFNERDVRFCEALAGYLSRCLLALQTRQALEADNSRLRVHSSSGDSVMIGNSPAMQRLRDQIRRMAQGPKVVLVVGDSGVGKELVALELHKLSSRSKGPLVSVNCAAIPPTMYEGELFGHCKGAFTGAVSDRAGFFQQAELGTLFMDEIGELSGDCQAKLLRVLENGTFRPVGARDEVKSDVRIIAATNRDLKKECLDKKFREDLFFRLGLEIRVPPLRERAEDIPLLVDHFLKRLTREYKKPATLSPSAMKRLQVYHWPGNVRQLRSVLEYAIAMGDGGVIEAEDLHVADSPSVPAEGASLNLAEVEAATIKAALARTGGTITQAAKMLGIHRDTLVAKMEKYEIEKKGQG